MGEYRNVINEIIDYLKNIFETHLLSIDNLLGQIEVIEWNGLKAVRKSFQKQIGLLKWLPPSMLYKASYPFVISPQERFNREVFFFSAGDGARYRVPRIYEVVESDLIIIREFIDGKPLVYNLDTCALIARALADVHLKGFALGDVKPSNFIIKGEDVYIIDAEQAVRKGSPELFGWDLMLTLLFASYRYVIDLNGFKAFTRKFLESYLDAGGQSIWVKSITSPKNLSIGLLMPLHYLKAVSDIVSIIL